MINEQRRFWKFGGIRKFTWLWINMRLSEEQFRRNSWTCKCYTALLPSWGENIRENCARKIFPEFQLSEKFCPLCSRGECSLDREQIFRNSKYVTRANKCASKNILKQQTNVLQFFFRNSKYVTRANKDCAQKNNLKQQICHESKQRLCPKK